MENKGTVKSSSPLCLSSYRLIRTDNSKTSSGSQPTSKPLFPPQIIRMDVSVPRVIHLQPVCLFFPISHPLYPASSLRSAIRPLLSNQTNAALALLTFCVCLSQWAAENVSFYKCSACNFLEETYTDKWEEK